MISMVEAKSAQFLKRMILGYCSWEKSRLELLYQSKSSVTSTKTTSYLR